MKAEYIIFATFLFFVILEIIFSNFFTRKNQTNGDIVVEIVSLFSSSIFIIPAVLAMGTLIASFIAPDTKDMLIEWSFVSVFVLLLLMDDLPQYFYHRLVHSTPWLYKLHRPHHEASYLSIRMTSRQNLLYYVLMPGYWGSGVVIYMGGMNVYVFYLAIKMFVIFSCHSDVRWDVPLYNNKWLSPVMYVVERVIVTPATHSSHHGKYADDGVTHYKGNYGNMLFIWDVMFGTAKITRKIPDQMGVENLPKTSVGEQLFWPLVRHRDKPETPQSN